MIIISKEGYIMMPPASKTLDRVSIMTIAFCLAFCESAFRLL